ncbi:site-specific integrase [uncultured Chryseobacterium sp.]|uniref:tyrosine-type recombinase/integrase n=1 Tax=uncultured Chryseobacterium sp. TaxID=259322 RepID=UPI0025842F58|nr:site-specific integrase [uncultured Chryseobacterium sp.]
MKNKWTKPKLKSSGNDWYVWFRFNGGHPIKVREDINKIEDHKEREVYGQALASVVDDRLKRGWIPVKKKTLPQPEDNNYSIIEAFDHAFKILETKLAKVTYYEYYLVYRLLKPVLKELDWHDHDIKAFESYHIKLLLDAAVSKYDWPNLRYNKVSNVLRSIFTVLKKEFIVKINPARGLEYLENEEPREIDLITDEEQKLIIEHYNKICPNFNVFLRMIYESGIRPAEIRRIQCSMINLDKKIITLPREASKTKGRRVPISNNLKEELSKFDLSNPEYYLFGVAAPHSKSIDKKFITAPYPISKSSMQRMWTQNAHDILKINKKMYWFKHKGANDKEENGMNLKTIKEVFGHSSEKITEIYATKHQEKEFEKARKLMPNFS